jgi:hypothetical protein
MKIGYCTKKILMGTLFATGKRVGRDLGGIWRHLTHDLLAMHGIGFIKDMLVADWFHSGGKEREDH